MSAIKLRIDIPEDHKVELTLPPELPSGPAVLTVVSESEPHSEGHRARCMGMDSELGWVSDDFDAPLPNGLQRLFEGEG